MPYYEKTLIFEKNAKIGPPGESPKSAILAFFEKTPEKYGRYFSVFGISCISSGERQKPGFFMIFHDFSLKNPY